MQGMVHVEINNAQVCGLLREVNKKFVFLLVHGFQANKKTKQFDAVEQALNDIGISTLRMDQFGHGDDAGRFPELTVSSAIASVKSAIDYLKVADYERIGVLGSSFGGLTGFFASFQDPAVSLIILKSPVLEQQGDIIARFKDLDVVNWQQSGIARWEDKLGSHRLRYGFYVDANKYVVKDVIGACKTPFLIVHGGADDVVPAGQCMGLKKKDNLTITIIESAKHKFNDEEMVLFVDAVRIFVQGHWFSS